MHLHIGIENVFALGVGKLAQTTAEKLGGMAVFKCYGHSVGRESCLTPWVGGNKMHLAQVERTAILFLRVVTARNVEHVVGDILAYHKPRPSAETEPLALAYGMEPIAAVLAELAACLNLDDCSGSFAEMTAYEVVIVDFAEETYSLRITAVGVGQFGFDGYAAYVGLGNVAKREDEMAELFP